MNRQLFNEHLQNLISLFRLGLLQDYPFESRQWQGCISNKYIIVENGEARINQQVVDKIKDWEFDQ